MQYLRESRTMEEEEPIILFHGPDFADLAQSILKSASHLVTHHGVRKEIRMGEIDWKKFEDGMPNLFIKNVEQIRGRDVVYLVSFLNPTEFVSQFSVLYALPRYLVKSLIIVMPYFPTGTMERVEEEGQIATAMTFAQLLCATPISIGGPARLILYDLHSLANRFYFNDNVIPLLVSAVPLFLEALKTHHHEENTVIAFPDDGAHKRFGKMFKNFPVIICIKVREGEKRIVTIKEGGEFVKDAHVFIVDDLVKTGGTLRETKDKLLQAGAKKVSAYVTHAVFPQDSWKKFTYENDKAAVGQFSNFYITDSVPAMASVLKDKKPFEILPLGPSIVENVLRY